MPSYVDELSDDRGRVIKALQSLIDEEEEIVHDLTDQLVEYREQLDRAVIRTMIYRNLYGPNQGLTVMAEKDAQDAMSPVNETTLRLDRETEILRVFRETIKQVEEGSPLSIALGSFI